MNEMNEMSHPIQKLNMTQVGQRASHGHCASLRRADTSFDSRQPVIDVIDSDGMFEVYADFRPVLESSGAEVIVEFSRQGVMLTAGPVERYLPIPTDAHVPHARVTVHDGTARLSIPTADSGHRWRSIVMW